MAAKDEYASRYLREIGASVTPETLKMIHDKMPLKKSMVSAAWKSRGGLEDRLYIAPHFHKPKEDSTVAISLKTGTASAAGGAGRNGLSKNRNSRMKGARGREENVPAQGEEGKSVSFAREDGTSAGTKEAGGRKKDMLIFTTDGAAVSSQIAEAPSDPAELEFEVMKRKYIYPFNTPSTLVSWIPFWILENCKQRAG